MIDRIHRAKSWQIFFLTFGLPIIIQLGFLIWMTIYFTFSNNPNFGFGILFILVIPIITIICMGGMFMWFWSISVGLQDYIDEDLKLSTGFFKFSVFFPSIYVVLAMFSFMPIPSNVFSFNDEIIFLLFPAHLVAMVCMFYLIYFSAKTIKTSELKRKVEFSDCAGDFMLLWFFPIGIWSIQKRINAITSDS